ncbi:MAG: GNAT family N-acetyltransferase, partial [Rhodoferax sp.]
ALPYEDAMQHLQGDLYVKKATIEFHASARIEDQLDVAMKCARVGNSSMLFSGAIFRGDALLITGELIYVFADPATQTSRPVPPALRDILTGFEAGQEMASVKIGSWHELGRDAERVRTEVFVLEQRIPRELEVDRADQDALHAVAYNRLGQPLATGRLLQQAPGIAQIGRMAVHRALRGSQLGQLVLQALTDSARERGDREVMLHAQRSAAGFYTRAGYAVRGNPFNEVGIAHVEMFKPL